MAKKAEKNVKKTTKKKLKIKIMPVIIVLLLFCIIIICSHFLSYIGIKNIYIKENTYLTDQEVIELAGIENYPSFIKTTSSMIKKRIKKDPLIKKVTVNKKLPAAIYINIEEYNILFRKEENNKIVLDNQKEIDDNNKYQVPILLNYIPNTKYDSFIKGMNNVKENIKCQISEIKYYPNEQDEDRFLLYMNDGNSVYLTLTKFKQINYYEDVLEKLEGKKGILYLDSGNHFQIMKE